MVLMNAEARAVINRDDSAGEDMASASAAPVLWYGLSPAADLWATIERIDAGGTEFTIVSGRRRQPVRTPLIGRHNVQNCLAAAACADAMDVPMGAIQRALEATNRIPGRLERVTTGAKWSIFVDYAHTDDALAHALHAAGSYIAYSEKRDGMLYTPEISRRARAVELWAALKYLGREGLDALVYDLPFCGFLYGSQGKGKTVFLNDPFTYEPLAWAINKGDPDFLNFLNNFFGICFLLDISKNKAV